MRRHRPVLPVALLAGGIATATGFVGCSSASVRYEDAPSRIARLQQATAEDVPELVESLAATDVLVRIAAIDALERLTGNRLGYDPAAPTAERREAIDRWVRYVAAPRDGRDDQDAGRIGSDGPSVMTKEQ